MADCQAVPTALVSFLSGLAGHTVVFCLSLASVKLLLLQPFAVLPHTLGVTYLFRFSRV